MQSGSSNRAKGVQPDSRPIDLRRLRRCYRQEERPQWETAAQPRKRRLAYGEAELHHPSTGEQRGFHAERGTHTSFNAKLDDKLTLIGGYQFTSDDRHWKQDRRKDDLIPDGNIRPGHDCFHDTHK